MTERLERNGNRKRHSLFAVRNCLSFFLLVFFTVLRCSSLFACSVTVYLPAAGKEAVSGLMMEAVRIGSVGGQDGKIYPEICYGIPEWPSGAVKISQAVAKVNSILEKRKADGSLAESSVYRARAGQDGVCVFRELPEGAYLIRQTDQKGRLKIEAAVVALSEKGGEKGQGGSGLPGAVSDAEVWPKAISLGELPPAASVSSPAPPVQTPRIPAVESSGKRKQYRHPPKERRKKKKEEAEESGPASSIPPSAEVRTGDSAPLADLALCMALSLFLFLLCLGLLSRNKLRRGTGKNMSDRNSMNEYLFSDRFRKNPAGRNSVRKDPFRICLFLLILFSCAGQVNGGQEEYDYAAHADEVCRITFQNVREEGTSLYVSKKVTKDAGTQDGDAGPAFSFHLILNGKKAAEQEYRLIGPDGEELFNYGTKETPLLQTGEDSSRLKVPFSCDSYGNFLLQAGQTAVFGGLRSGTAYEVTENCPDDYEIVSPEGVPSFSGSIGEEGSHVLFVNRYLPDTPSDETASLRVRKAVPFPEELERPFFPAFRIRVKIDGKNWSRKEISFCRSDDGAAVRSSCTDEDGILEICPGETAVLNEIPHGAEYELEELCDPQQKEESNGSEPAGLFLEAGDFCLFGNKVRRGSVDDPAAVTFTNLLASFLVSKTVRDTDPQRPFRFVLTDGENQACAGRKYLLYDAGGQLVPKENGIAAPPDSPAGSPENGSCHVTDEKGRFLLKAGQKAVFIGIIPGTRFNVREEASFGFTQITPESADGYRDRIVSESPQTLLFENIRAPGLLLPDAGGQGIWISLLLSGLLCCVLLLFFCRGFRTAEAAGRKRSFRSGQPVCRRKRQCFGTGPEQGEIRTAGSAEKTLSGKRAWPEKAPDSGNSRGNRKRGDRRHEK